MYLSVIAALLVGAGILIFVVQSQITILAIAFAFILIGIGWVLSAGLVVGQA